MTTYRIAVGFTKFYLVNVAAPSKADGSPLIGAAMVARTGVIAA